MTTLTDFLLARIEEDEERADRLRLMKPLEPPIFGGDSPRMGYYSVQARVLAECRAKRALLDHAADFFAIEHEWASAQILRILAAPYADHPDYNPDWRP